jgi:membrane-bound lytic murein transglycosylase A
VAQPAGGKAAAGRPLERTAGLERRRSGCRLAAFLQSCRALASRPQWPQWKTACEEAKGLTTSVHGHHRRFFEARFQPWRLTNPDGSTGGLVTGYYEPLLRGARTRGKPYLQPVLGVPPDLLTIDLGTVLPELKNMRLRGRLQGNKVVPYYSRAEITSREKDYADRALLYVDDPVELFFLQVQGSGRVSSPTAAPYASPTPTRTVTRTSRSAACSSTAARLTLDQASMARDQAMGAGQPGRLGELLNSNPSYVFFREQAGKSGQTTLPKARAALSACR